MSPALVTDAIAAVEAGLNLASGLHARLRDQPAIKSAAEEHGRKLFDVRDPPPVLPIGKGYRRPGHRLLTVGTDCSVGKMYTTLAIERRMHELGIAADFRATGQTGILIAGSGIPVDAVVADFIAGSVEHLAPGRGDGGWDLIEGQGSLFHPSFAGVSLGLLHGAQPDVIVLCHEPGREHMRGLRGRPLPPLDVCLRANLEAAKLTSPEVVCAGVALNTASLSQEKARRVCADVARSLGLPCQDPVRDGVAQIVEQVLKVAPAAGRSA